jgi:uncharacterized protein (TIGR03118 family)
MTSPGRRLLATATVAGCALALASPALAARRGHHHGRVNARVVETDLVSDVPGWAATTDPHLVNAWGLSAGPSTPLWVADNGTMLSTLYTGLVPQDPVSILPLVVNVIGPVTGTVFNPGPGFVVSDGSGHSDAAKFLFATEDGQIIGWSPNVPPPPTSTQGEVGTATPGGNYKGLTMAMDAGAARLYAANFATGGVDVFDDTFAPIVIPGAFTDAKLPPGYAPFNVQELGGKIYVAYAKQDAAKHDEVAGPGRGFVDVYDTHGMLLKRLIRRGALNAPWGLALAPASWGQLAGKLLVGNFGNGRIHVYSLRNGHLIATLRGMHGTLSIDGLWGLRPGNGTAGSTDAVWFSAGPDDESHGLLGTLTIAKQHHHHHHHG